jgi:hypothetical protein
MINADNLKWIIPSKEHSTISENCIRYIKAGQQYNMNTVDDEVIIQLIINTFVLYVFQQLVIRR